MSTDACQIRSFCEPKSTLGRIVQFPLVRTLIALLFLVPVLFLTRLLADLVVDLVPETYAEYVRDGFGVLRLLLLIYAYGLYTRFVEKRAAFEMSFVGSWRETAWGVRIGGGIMIFMVGLMYVLSYYEIEYFGSFEPVFHGLFFFGFAAFVEEVIFRAILFRHIEELTGSWGAIVLVGLAFGFVHAANPNATLWTSTAISIQSLILAGAYMLTRRIWMVWGLHVGWNYFQSAVFGVAVSGASDFDSLIVGTTSGPDWLTGGEFGVEGSYLATAIVAVFGVLLIIKAKHNRHLLKPMWTKKLKEVELPPLDNLIWRPVVPRKRNK